MTTETEAQAQAEPTPASGAVVIHPEAVAAFAAMAADIPEAGDSGYEGILLQLMATEDPAALDAPWRSDGLREFLDQPLSIQGLRRMESEYDSGLPFFLIVEAGIIGTGESVTVTTGAVSVVAQLVRAWSLGLIPGWRVIPRQSDRPSKSGYYPQHLEVMRGRVAAEA